MPADVQGMRKVVFTTTGIAAVAITAVCLLVFATHRTRSVDLPIDPAIPIAPVSVDLPLPHLTDYRLPNGLRVLLLEDHRLPRFEATMAIDAGEVRAPYRGIAELTAKMLLEGTTTCSADQQAQAVADLGASFTSSAHKDGASVKIYGLSEDAPAMLDLLADAVLHPAFRMDRFSKRIEAWTARDDELGAMGLVAGQVADAAIYGAGPYGRYYARSTDVAGLVPSDLVAFHQQWYRPENTILTVVGDVDVPVMKQEIAALFGSWAPSAEPADVPPHNVTASRPDSRPHIHLIDWPYENDVWLMYAAPTVLVNDPDYPAVQVAAHLLDWQLFEDLRESRGVTYDASATAETEARYPGLWLSVTNIPIADTEITLRDTDMALAAVRAGKISDAELEQAKRVAAGQLAQQLESRVDLAGWYATDVRAGLPADSVAMLPERLMKVTAADVQRVAIKYLTPSRLQILVVGPRRVLESPLRDRGVVSFYDGRGKLLVP